MQIKTSDSASIRSIYRKFLQYLRLIPDSEIRRVYWYLPLDRSLGLFEHPPRHYYYERCRTIADAATEGAHYKQIPDVPEAPSRDPARLLSKLQRVR